MAGTGNSNPKMEMEIMIKFPELEGQSKKVKYTNGLDGADFIPVDCGGHLLGNPLSVNELGKQLLKAAADGDVEETGNLVSKGALFTADWLGTSPLHLAARNNHLEVCQILLKAGISQDARTKVDKTSLHMAATEGHPEVVEILLEYGSDPDCRDLLGMTPLHWAVQNCHIRVIEILLKNSAQTDVVNKFGLTPADIALQLNRLDLLELLNMDNSVQHMTLQWEENDVKMTVVEDEPESISNSPIPLETILLEDVNGSIDPETLNSVQRPNVDSNFAESIRLLQEHGITMLPHEDNNILTTVMKTGHSVVLTDVGKEVLKSVKEAEKTEKIITVTPEEFASMTANGTIKSKRIFQQINGKFVPKTMKRVMVKKNKVVPVADVNKVFQVAQTNGYNDTDSTVMAQLMEARKTIEEYKIRLMKKEEEIERYKEQIRLLTEDS